MFSSHRCSFSPARMSCLWTKFFIFYIVLYHCAFTTADKKDGVFERIKNGLKYARSYLETAKEIADLVAKSLKQNNDDKKRGDDGVKNEKTPNVNIPSYLTSAFFRLLGLDSSKIAAVTVNSVIFLAQLINLLMENKQEEKSRHGDDINNDQSNFDPLKLFMNSKNERIQGLVKLAQSPRLPERLIEQLDDADLSCVRLFMCKITPIILNAQKSLKKRSSNKRFDLTSWLPDREKFEDNGEQCEERFHDCVIFPDEFETDE